MPRRVISWAQGQRAEAGRRHARRRERRKRRKAWERTCKRQGEGASQALGASHFRMGRWVLLPRRRHRCVVPGRRRTRRTLPASTRRSGSYSGTYAHPSPPPLGRCYQDLLFSPPPPPPAFGTKKGTLVLLHLNYGLRLGQSVHPNRPLSPHALTSLWEVAGDRKDVQLRGPSIRTRRRGGECQ